MVLHLTSHEGQGRDRDQDQIRDQDPALEVTRDQETQGLILKN